MQKHSRLCLRDVLRPGGLTPASQMLDLSFSQRARAVAWELPRRLLARKFARDVLVLQAGTLVRLALVMGSTALLARVLGPEGLGRYNLVLAYFTTINLFGNFGVGQAVLTRLAAARAAGDREEMLALMAYYIKMSLLVGAVLTGGAWLLAPELAQRLGYDAEVGRLARLLFLVTPCGILYGLTTTVAQSARDMKGLALLETLSVLFGAVCMVAGAWLAGLGGVIAGSMAGTALSALAGWLHYRLAARPAGYPPEHAVAWLVPRVPLRRFLRFSALVTLDKNMATMFSQTPTLFLGRLAGDAETAFFGVATNVFRLPELIQASIARNLMVKLSEQQGRGDIAALRRTFWLVTFGAGAISIVTTAAFVLVAPWLVEWLYGREFRAALPAVYVYAGHMAVLGFATGISSIFQIQDRVGVNILIKLGLYLFVVPLGWWLVATYRSAGAAAYVWAADLSYIPYALVLLSNWFWRTPRSRRVSHG
jgi:O-antigen/teichoic acid export membrane protein